MTADDDLIAVWEFGPNVSQAIRAYGWYNCDTWLDEIIWGYTLAKAASQDVAEHVNRHKESFYEKHGRDTPLPADFGTNWPNHAVYGHSGGFGGYFSDVWKKHEGKIREFLGAYRASRYEKTSDDPAQRMVANKVVEQLKVADRAAWKDIKGIRVHDLPWGAYIAIIEDVRPHGENLSIVTVDGHEVVANRKEDGSFRWQKGEPCIYVPENAIIPDAILQARGYWDAEKGKGLLEGKKGNRVKMRRFAGFESRGLLFKVGHPGLSWDEECPEGKIGWIDRENVDQESLWVGVDDDVTEFLGITEHVPEK
jgi:hypothetical protein